jgi:hypothetical protein
MASHVILRPIGGSPDALRILDEFESRTGLISEARGDDRLYGLHGPDHRKDIIQTLTEIDRAWTEHVGLRFPE